MLILFYYELTTSPFSPISSATLFIPSIVCSITSSKGLSSISHPFFMTSLFTPAAKPLDLNFFLTDFTPREGFIYY